MVENFAVWLLGRLLKRNLSIQTRNKIVIHILQGLHSIPLTAIISVNEEGEMIISGSSVDIEKGRQLQAHARAALQNKALNLIGEQVVYEAFIGAANKAIIPDDLLFYRAALWWGQQIEKYLILLAGRQEPTLEG